MANKIADAAGDIEKMDISGASDEETPESILEEFTKVYGELKEEWDKGKSTVVNVRSSGRSRSTRGASAGRTGRSLTKVGSLLNQAKLLIAKMDPFLSKFNRAVGLVELTNIRTVLEIGAYYSLELDQPDIDQFKRYTAQLKSYYLDYTDVLPESCHKYELYCAKLLCLLTENRVSDFHSELALILYPPDQVKIIQHNNPILFKTLKIAESLEDGRYNAFDRKAPSQHNLDPSTEQGKLASIEAQGDKALHDSDTCSYFLNQLVASYRPDIAETLEASYESWPKTLAMQRLHFQTNEELEKFAKERKWISKDGKNYTYQVTTTETTPAKRLIQESLHYARDLEQII